MEATALYSVTEALRCVGVSISMDERYPGLDYRESLHVDQRVRI